MAPGLFQEPPNQNEAVHKFNPLYVSLLLLSIFALYKKLIRGGKIKPKYNLPPSPPKLPVIGNLHQLSSQLHLSLTALSKKYGGLMLLHMGQEPTLIVSSDEMAREMMKTHDIVFSNRPHITGPKVFLYDCKDLAFAPYGDYWRRIRKISVIELLSNKQVLASQYVKEEEVGLLVERLQKASLEGLTVNLSEMLISASNNVLLRCVHGKKFEGGKNGVSEYDEASRRMLEQFLTFCFADFIPSLRWLDNVRGIVSKLNKTRETFDTIIEGIVQEHKAKIGTHKLDHEKDFVDILFELQKSGTLDFDLTDDNIKAITADMLVAGSDTSSTTMDWTMAELIKNPAEMKKVQEEVRRIVGKKRKIDLNDLNEMVYLECAIKESLRLHPPAPLLSPRQTSASVRDMKGYEIPFKTRVLVNVYAIQRDPKLWRNPDKFIPERFLKKQVEYIDQDEFKFLPFGGGRRGCPGLAFAVSSVKCFLANLLYWFDWKLPDDNAIPEDLDMGETSGIVVVKKIPLHVKPISYSP